MKLIEAIRILEAHNNWRRDNKGVLPMIDPKILGEAIDIIVIEFKKITTNDTD